MLISTHCSFKCTHKDPDAFHLFIVDVEDITATRYDAAILVGRYPLMMSSGFCFMMRHAFKFSSSAMLLPQSFACNWTDSYQ